MNVNAIYHYCCFNKKKKIEHHSHSGIQIKMLRTNLQQFILDRKQLKVENNDITS